MNKDSGWGWDELLPFFKKSEIFHPPNEFQRTAGDVRYDASVHGFDGNVKVGFPNYFFPQSNLWEKATESLGIPPSPDMCNGSPNAVGVSPNSIDPFNVTR